MDRSQDLEMVLLLYVRKYRSSLDPAPSNGTIDASDADGVRHHRTIVESDHPTTSEIAAITDHPRSTIHYHLNTMRRNRYVVKDDEGYRLGLRMGHMGDLARQHHALSGMVEKPVDETDVIAQVVVVESGKAVTLYTAPLEMSTTFESKSVLKRISIARRTDKQFSLTSRSPSARRSSRLMDCRLTCRRRSPTNWSHERCGGSTKPSTAGTRTWYDANGRWSICGGP